MRQLKIWSLIILLILPAVLFAAEATKPTTIILVRHAEKQSNAENPDLSAAGQARARDLVRLLESSGIRAVYCSQYLRTRRTLEPLATFLKLTPIEVNADKTDELVKRIFAEHSGEVVLVAGHSDTVPEIIGVLGASVPSISDSEYDNLYVVTASAPGKAVVVRLKFGAAAEVKK